jgi:ribulose-phosphate 3-epimerase
MAGAETRRSDTKKQYHQTGGQQVKAKIAASILSADFTHIADAVKTAEDGGADFIHVDIMDGHFVPNLTFGPQLVRSIKKICSLPLDVHLMVDNPGHFIPLFQKAGADWISIHWEACPHLHQDIKSIKDLGCRAGLVLNPATPIHVLTDIIKDLDYVLIMTVNPGWGAQNFIDNCRNKISQLRNWIQGQKLEIAIEVDGGIKLENMEGVIQAGAEILVIGSGIYNCEDPKAMLKRMNALIERIENS